MWREAPSSKKSWTNYTLLTILGEFMQYRPFFIFSRYEEILQQIPSLSSLGLCMRPFLPHPTQVHCIHCAPSTGLLTALSHSWVIYAARKQHSPRDAIGLYKGEGRRGTTQKKVTRVKAIPRPGCNPQSLQPSC